MNRGAGTVWRYDRPVCGPTAPRGLQLFITSNLHYVHYHMGEKKESITCIKKKKIITTVFLLVFFVSWSVGGRAFARTNRERVTAGVRVANQSSFSCYSVRKKNDRFLHLTTKTMSTWEERSLEAPPGEERRAQCRERATGIIAHLRGALLYFNGALIWFAYLNNGSLVRLD